MVLCFLGPVENLNGDFMSNSNNAPPFLSPHSNVDIRTWKRREHFLFFREFEEPYFGITVNVDCSKTFDESKATGQSFYYLYLHRILQVCNDIPALKLRMPTDNEVWSFDNIHASTTQMRKDQTFAYSLIPYQEQFDTFIATAQRENEAVQRSNALFSESLGSEPRLDVIHFSALPWIKFTGLSHARYFSRLDSVPKVSVGKCEKSANGAYEMPVSLHLHHALADGSDAALFFEKLESLI